MELDAGACALSAERSPAMCTRAGSPRLTAPVQEEWEWSGILTELPTRGSLWRFGGPFGRFTLAVGWAIWATANGEAATHP